MTAVFAADLARARPYTYAMWQQRPLREKLAEKVLLPIKSQL
jgi:cardiolipin synthase